ncbi:MULTISPECIES: hypothetical protein [Mammaliicoccus]|uniref:Uncharacterized protein n=1 Tax=Mammaliicoccus sciuri TaxID=1296 RepID=A0ABT7HYC2_MAMSC|nr:MULTISPECIES: hypothetical protein [Mammaliicoccus]MCJ0914542.1 hypothetical protein [Mammaliicoccus sciuri]MDL0112728.1 hypothetical protein [Mammaliicoccus sciuri]MDL0117152.1 hypothetical protein [Mammaliicoccus sciuri]WQJ65919.1 hypothetical protein P3T97_00475 [Mammaliicoccus sciuri]
MSTIYLKDLQKDNKKNKSRNIEFIRKNYDPDFYLGKRDFDKPRKNPKKQKAVLRYGRK